MHSLKLYQYESQSPTPNKLGSTSAMLVMYAFLPKVQVNLVVDKSKVYPYELEIGTRIYSEVMVDLKKVGTLVDRRILVSLILLHREE